MRRMFLPGLLAAAVVAVSSLGMRPFLQPEAEASPAPTLLAWPQARAPEGIEDPVRLVVILASGWNTNGNGSPGKSWSTVSKALMDLGEERVAVLPFSYTGDRRYAACDTNQPVARSAAMLHAQAVVALEQHPRAQLMVAGHSLGGVVATYWLARTLPGADAPDEMRARLERSAVVTLDSPVRGLSWAEADDTLFGGRIAEAVAESNCASAIPDELDPGSDLVRALADASPFSRYYNIASLDDRIISEASSVLGEDPSRALRVPAGDGGCARSLWNGGYLRDPLHPISNTAKCWLESHGAVLSNRQAVDWLSAVAALQLAAAIP